VAVRVARAVAVSSRRAEAQRQNHKRKKPLQEESRSGLFGADD
jgi:hypothetical protein